VLVLHLSNGQSAGIVMGTYWNESNAPVSPEAVFRKDFGNSPGEAFMEFSGGRLTIHADSIVIDGVASINGNADITGEVSINGNAGIAGAVSINGDTGIDGTISINGNAGITGSVSADGNIAATGDVTGRGISLSGHTHTGTHGETSPPH